MSGHTSLLARAANIAELRDMARRRLPKGLFEFLDRGTEDEIALRENRAAFERIRLRPRVLNDVSKRSLETELFGKPSALPLAIAPTGAAGLLWHRGEAELAIAARDARIPFTLATGSMSSIEEIAEIGGRLWMQLYPWEDRDLTYAMIARAHAAGFEALVVTVDTAVSPNREYNARNGFALPLRPTPRNMLDVARHPHWMFGTMLKTLMNGGIPGPKNFPEGLQTNIAQLPSPRLRQRHDTLTWQELRHIRSLWPGILMVKGILHADDAALAVGAGADGIIVSNHGGRNLDSVIATIDALPAIVASVGGKATILLDSGIRRGSDVLKALALGASAVLVGRATLYGVALGGAEGASRAIGIIRSELDRDLALCGCRDVSEISRDLLWSRSALTPGHSFEEGPRR